MGKEENEKMETDNISENSEDVEVINVRQSIHNIKNQLHVILERNLEDTEDDRQWNLWHLKKIFKSKDLQDLFKIYIKRLHQSFFALLMLVQAIVFGGHFLVILIYSQDPSANVLELAFYALIVCLSIIMFLLANSIKNFSENWLTIVNIVFFALLYLINWTPPIFYYYFHNSNLRPAYTTHIIISCYVFFSISNFALNVTLGVFTSIIHLLMLGLVTYHDVSPTEVTKRILTDGIFLLCMNGLGIYYKYLNEVIKRKSFLDRRACVLYNRHLAFQKDQEETLMATLIPKYVVDNVRSSFLLFWDSLQNLKSSTKSIEYKSSFTQAFPNVTILFADVVNYTEMTVKLDINELLETLNELFGNFDDAAEKFQVLRIKFLGDCYYCAAGLPPNPPENQGEACVDLGLEMIKIIAEVRRKRNVNINMRIGVHTGNIISGIIGYQKICFDIWSKDVSLANQMETEGEAGKVHLTKQTLSLLKKSYNITPTNKGETVEQFRKFGIDTFLVSPDTQKSTIEKKRDTANIYRKNRNSNLINKRTSNSKTSTKTTGNSIYSHKNSIDEDYIHEDLEEPSSKNVQYYKLIETSYIEEEKQENDNVESFSRNAVINRNSGVKNSNDPRDSHRRAAFMNSNIKRYQDTMKAAHNEMRAAIDSLLLNKFQQWCKWDEINPVTLLFTQWKYELDFIRLPDPLFKYYLLSVVLLIIFLFIIQNLTLAHWHWGAWWIFVTIAVITFIFVPLMWMHHFLKHFKNKFFRQCAALSKVLTISVWSRLIMYTIVCVMFTLCVFSELINCQRRYAEHEAHFERTNDEKRSLLLLMTNYEEKHFGICIVPWHMTQTCALAVIMSFFFLRMIMWVKFTFAVTITLLYSISVWYFSDDIFTQNGETYNYMITSKVSHILAVVSLTFTLHIIDRQTEYMNRMDFLWNKNKKVEEEKTRSAYIINKMLLNNTLPEHLSTMYLDVKRPPAALYHERYSNAAVMFASVVGYQIDDVDDDELLMLMADIISEFDKLLIKNDYVERIEKIKVAKWTYMAACGISPGVGNTEQKDPSTHIEALLKFASDMIIQLNKLNREVGQDLKLRVGISNGEIVAGVVGSRKPLYDIWGDPVNMAARMDTTGVPNKIHVLERTVNIIKRNGYKCILKGQTVVKGLKEPVPTYFVDLNEKFELIRTYR